MNIPADGTAGGDAVAGVNGVGKTTTVAKLAARMKAERGIGDRRGGRYLSRGRDRAA